MTVKIQPGQLQALIRTGLEEFYKRRLSVLQKLQLKKILSRKNPYLFRALATEKASEIVEQILAAYVSSSDETIFGDAFFESVARAASDAKVSDARGVDFIIEKTDRYTAVSLKSGPNIFSASQKRRQNDEFNELRSRLLKLHKRFDPLLAHAYGRRNADPTAKWIYRERSGQAFWAEITGDSDFYLKLIRLMKGIPAKHKKAHAEEWGAAVNRFTVEFARDFCLSDGRIDWEKLVKFVSEAKPSRDKARVSKTKRS